MDLALAQVAAGLPMVASLALAGGVATLREGRRRSALNEAMHELRRPLQALSLSLPADPRQAAAMESSLRMAKAALERLDREINGEPVAATHRPIEVESFLRTVVGRWRPQAARAGRRLTLRGGGAGSFVCGDEVQIGQAVDNMISNALEHGGGEVIVEARAGAGRVLLRVLDRGGRSAQRRSLPGPRARLSGRHRHGHGLRVARQVARAHEGGFRLLKSGAGTEARLDLPLGEPQGGR